ncbi:MAG: SUMF1/EgtB/PvdO family nonheme iron enzyme [Prolixibacteraceae bacterium]|nr:SUMF1/EgtB/PvdO family nonheme iron enzyme [Prolixibacteraceae bacterium]
MKNYTLIFALAAIVFFASCSQSGESGELTGATQSRGSWFEPVPYGMAFVKRGAIRIGPSDEDPTSNITPTRSINVDAFWMDDTEITNNEYRQFTSWVRDSIARKLLYNSSNPNAQYYANLDIDGNYIGLNWEEPIEWGDTLALEDIYIPANERFYGNRELDTRKLFYDYSWIDLQKAARRANMYNYEEQSYGGGITDRSDFIVRERTHVYPDTLVWIRDFTYSYNEPRTSKYYWHPGFDNYPVVGVTWKQAKAFCQWRTQRQNEYFARVGNATVMDYRLPTEYEWEYAARGGLQNAMYPWGGYYSRNQMGEFMANYKPMRGNYSEDGGLATMKVAEYPPNDFGLYDMAGNVAEWTSTAYDDLAPGMVNELNPDFKYNAKDDDPPAMKRKVIRGGSWKDVGFYIQVSTRTYEYQDTATSFIGFRCVRPSFGNEF